MKELGPDFYNITDLLTEEELMIQKTTYEFVQTEFMPFMNITRMELFLWSWLQSLGSLGLWAHRCRKNPGVQA